MEAEGSQTPSKKRKHVKRRRSRSKKEDREKENKPKNRIATYAASSDSNARTTKKNHVSEFDPLDDRPASEILTRKRKGITNTFARFTSSSSMVLRKSFSGSFTPVDETGPLPRSRSNSSDLNINNNVNSQNANSIDLSNPKCYCNNILL